MVANLTATGRKAVHIAGLILHTGTCKVFSCVVDARQAQLSNVSESNSILPLPIKQNIMLSKYFPYINVARYFISPKEQRT